MSGYFDSCCCSSVVRDSRIRKSGRTPELWSTITKIQSPDTDQLGDAARNTWTKFGATFRKIGVGHQYEEPPSLNQ